MKELMRIEKPNLFSFRECLWYLDRGYDDCLYKVADEKLTRLIQLNGNSVLFRITEAGNTLAVHLLEGKVDASQLSILREYIIGWFDMNTDITPFYELLRKDKKLHFMPRDFHGLRLIGIADLFEALCWSIIGQQINLTFAYKLKRRLVEAYGKSVAYDGQFYHLFPAPETLAGLNPDDLRPMQFSQSKAKYLIGIADVFASGKLNLEILTSLPDFTGRQQALTAHKGVGIWTANYVLMKTLREPNAIPYGDAGLLKALENLEVIKERNESAKIERFFKKYKGWEAYLVFYLWRSLTTPSFHNK